MRVRTILKTIFLIRSQTRPSILARISDLFLRSDVHLQFFALQKERTQERQKERNNKKKERKKERKKENEERTNNERNKERNKERNTERRDTVI